VRLTEAGRALVRHADVILARLADAEAELEAIAGLRGGRVRLASFASAGAVLMPLAIAIFSKRHPGIELSLTEGEPDESLPKLKAGELEIALTYRYDSLPADATSHLTDGVDMLHLLGDEMVVALNPDHPLAKKSNLRMKDLAGERWIQSDPADMCGMAHQATCRAAGFEAQVGFESDDNNVIQGLVAAGVGVSLLPELALTNLREDIVIRRLPRREKPMRQIYASTLAGAYRSPATEAMLETLQEAAREHEARYRVEPAVRAVS
jgi:DNA-binding transcriptional LysR family regulator